MRCANDHQVRPAPSRYTAQDLPRLQAPLTTLPTFPAHDAHAPLRRLSAAAISACRDDEVLDALVAEAKGALLADRVELVVPSRDDVPAVAHVTATREALVIDEARALLVPVTWGVRVRQILVLERAAAAARRRPRRRGRPKSSRSPRRSPTWPRSGSRGSTPSAAASRRPSATRRSPAPPTR